MKSFAVLCSALLVQTVVGQTPSNTSEVHPKLDTYRCTVAGGCKKTVNYLVVESSQHGLHQVGDMDSNCGHWGEGPNTTACPDEASCAKNCIIEGIPDYSRQGITTSGDSLRLTQLSGNRTVSPRLYFLEENEEKYDMLYLTGAEFSFDVEMDKLPCGMNSALYLSEMRQDGGKGLSPHNKAGPYYGTGYCDAQCFVTPFINGVANLDARGACCNELDIWEANSRSTHIAPHPCSEPGLYECTGDECGPEGVCDKPGCAWNHNRVNQTDFYGRGGSFKVDTTRKFTVVSQFLSDKAGKLTELHRHYVQDGRIIESAVVNIEGPPKVNFINDEYCEATNATSYMRLGGTQQMGEAMSRGMVLVISLWWDEGGFMEWLDQGNNGPCDATEGDPKNIVKLVPNPEVTFSNIRVGELNSTFATRQSNAGYGWAKRKSHRQSHLYHHQRQHQRGSGIGY
ncbi:hypothetical protein F66182_8157 [Fusarium sp. NRRL 66182]|nr:hypothetical protein F66182_8157 [Fusarium sp. NRRL 66182]